MVAGGGAPGSDAVHSARSVAAVTAMPASSLERCLGGEVDRDVLRLEVLFEALVTALATETRLLDPAEGRGGVRDHALVQADHACLETLDHAERAPQVARVDVGYEAILRVVGRGDRLLFGVEREDRGHRAEDLLVPKVRLLGHVTEYGRLVEVALAVEPLSPDERLRALVQSVVDEFLDLTELVLVDERPNLCALLRAAGNLQLVHLLRQLLRELVCYRVGDVEPVGRRAGLAYVTHLGHHRPRDGIVNVRVLEDEEGCVAAELHRDPKQVLRSLLHELTPDRRRTRKGQLA